MKGRKKLVFLVSLVAVMFLSSTATWAHKPTDSPHQFYEVGDFQLESGEVIKDFKLCYVTHGTLNKDKSNAILVCTALTGNHHRLDFLIGPGKALDTSKYFIIVADAIGNGLTTSPSNSASQPGMQFPRFTIRDMVQSQYRLLTEHLGIDHLVAVIGPSMGGMQALQWAVSYPDFMDSVIALVPLFRTPSWTVLWLEITRKAIMLDPNWNNGAYTTFPEQGVRLWRDILNFLIARTPSWYHYQFPEPLDVLPWLKAQEDALLQAFHPVDYIYQTWAYENHDISKTPGMNGDMVKALRAIKAKTLIMVGVNDLLNPENEVLELAKYIRDVRCVTINPQSISGHLAASGVIPADVEFIDQEVRDFLEIVTRGKLHT